jgi:tRNA nucleotidyltransferase (CCA-adding enzyme)
MQRRSLRYGSSSLRTVVCRVKFGLQGKDLKAVPSAPREPGPWTGRALAQVMEWQLEHPNRTKEECTAWLDEQFSNGLVDISSDPPANQKRVKSGEGNAAKKTKH